MNIFIITDVAVVIAIVLTSIGGAIGGILAYKKYDKERPKKKNRNLIISITVFFVAGIIAGAIGIIQIFPNTVTNPYSCVADSITIDGSSAFARLVQKVAYDYQQKCSMAHINVLSNGSEQGKSQLANCQKSSIADCLIQIADSDTFIDYTQSNLIDHTVAIVVFTIVVNVDVIGVTNLTTQQIQGIYNGTYTNWNQLQGPDLKIRPISRDINSGAHNTFKQYVLPPGSTELPQNSYPPDDDKEANLVQTTPGAIGYVALPTVINNHMQEQVVAINGFMPTDFHHHFDNVTNNSYKFWNFEHMYTRGIPPYNSLITAFIDYMYSPVAIQYTHSLSYLSFNDMLLCALNQHNHPASFLMRC
jgi:phosphate transport system substrate-binding protein